MQLLRLEKCSIRGTFYKYTEYGTRSIKVMNCHVNNKDVIIFMKKFHAGPKWNKDDFLL